MLQDKRYSEIMNFGLENSSPGWCIYDGMRIIL